MHSEYQPAKSQSTGKRSVRTSVSGTVPFLADRSDRETGTPRGAGAPVSLLAQKNSIPVCVESPIPDPAADPYLFIQGNKSHTAHSIGVDELSPSDNQDDHKQRLVKYAQAHKRTLEMSKWILEHVVAPGEMHLAKLGPESTLYHDRKKKLTDKKLLATDLKTCGDYLIFRDYYTVKQIRLHGMTSCKKHLLCPLCAIRRGAKSTKAYLDRLEVIQAAQTGLKAFLVTFTVKNGEDLKERYNHLQNSMKKYNLRRSNANTSKKHLPVEGNKALGAVWSYEFKRGAGSGIWHPHAHAIWLCRETPDQLQLRKEWQEITGDSHIVDVTPFEDQGDVVGGFLEVFKYAVKFSDMPLADNYHGYQVLNGRRLVASLGLFRGVVIPEKMTDDELEKLPYYEHFYRYMTKGYKLQKSKHNDGLPF